MPSKQRQRRQNRKSHCSTGNTPSSVDQESQSDASPAITHSTPITDSKKRGRPKKTVIGQATTPMNATVDLASKNITLSATPRTTRFQSETASPLPKKEKIFVAFIDSSKLQYAVPCQSPDFSTMGELVYAEEKSTEAEIWRRAGLSLFQFDDQPDKGLRLMEIAWNNLDNWMSGSFIFAYLCVLAKNSNRQTLVVDPILTDPSITRGKPSVRSIRRSCFPDAISHPEVVVIPLYFTDHWALLIHDIELGTYFVDSLAEDPHRLKVHCEENTARLMLIQSVILEFFPELSNTDIDFQVPSTPVISRQPDGNSCGYYCCLFAEAWLFNNGCLRLEPMVLNAEKKRILWHINQLYSTDVVQFHSRYRESDVDMVSESSLSSSSTSRGRGRPKKKSRGSTGRPRKRLSEPSPTERTPRRSQAIDQPTALFECLRSNSIKIPSASPWNADRIATHELLDAANDIQHLWNNPTEWMTEDLIFGFQRYIASICYGRHVSVLIPQYSNPVVHSGVEVIPDNAVENCYNYSPEYDVLLMTIFFPGHFALVIFDRSVRDSPQCLFIDPLAEQHDRLYDTLYPLYDARRIQLITNTICALTPGLDKREFVIQPLRTSEFTPQKDGVNCGFFVCLYSESYLLKGTLHIPNLNINYQRKRILWHLAQLIGSDDIPYLALHPQSNSVVADSLSPSRPQQSSIAEIPVYPRKLSSSISSISSKATRRSARISQRQSAHSSVSSSRSPSPRLAQGSSNPITQRCYRKHSDYSCGDVRAKHTTSYYDSGNLGDAVCHYCDALLFSSEAEKKHGKVSSGMCCNHGRIDLPPLKDYPDEMLKLLKGDTKESQGFLSLENAYNSLMAFASVSVGHKDSTLDDGACFLLNGEFIRRVSSMRSGDAAPAFTQLYFLDPAAAQHQREQNFKYGGDRVDPDVLQRLDAMIREHHPLAKELMNFHNQYQRELTLNGPDAVSRFRFTLLEARDAPTSVRDPTDHPNLTNLPDEGGSLFAVWTEQGEPPVLKGIWITTSEGKLTKIQPYHPLTDTLCYPLLFPRGDDGYHRKIPLKSIEAHQKKKVSDDSAVDDCAESGEESATPPESDEESVYSAAESESSTKGSRREFVSIRQYIRHRLAVRKGQEPHHIWSHGGGLSQKLVLDYAARIDAGVADYLRKPELDLRSTLPENVLRWLTRNAGLASADDLGSVVMFRRQHPGTRPYMQEKYYDATHIMSRIRRPGVAGFMLTFTCNPKWPEIRRNLFHDKQKTIDRADLICRVFEDKKKHLMNLLLQKNIFGKIHAQTSREYQKKYGGPHIHSIFQSDILALPENIENLIWAHIPPEPDADDKSDWANLIRKVRELLPKHQFHDCGPNCLKPNGRCRKGFPKPFSTQTILHDDRPATLYRPSPADGGETMKVKKGNTIVEYDNQRVVEYNPLLLVLFETHHQLVPYYGKATKYKYGFKYPFKASSFSYVKNQKENNKTDLDEPAYFAKMYYRSPPEAYSRIMGFKYAELSHTVVHLKVHLPGKQKVYLKPGQIDDVAAQIQAGILPETALTSYWKQWANDPDIKNTLFENMPEKYSLTKAKTWKKRTFSKLEKNIKKRKPVVGRIYPVSPRENERFALYLLTRHFPGDPDHLKTVTVNGVQQTCATFLEAARLRGLLEDNDIWLRTLDEAANSFMPNQMRQLFANILVFGSTQDNIVDGAALWEHFLPHFYDSRCTDAQRPARIDRALAQLERLLVAQGRQCSDFGLPTPSVSIANNPNVGLNSFFFPQQTNNLDDDDDDQVDTTCYQNGQLNPRQQEFFDLVKSIFDDPLQRRLIYLKGGGGTGKTYLLNYILYHLRQASVKIIPTASTGMASTRFYSGGTTVHSAFRMGIQNEPGKLPQIEADSFFGRRIIEAQIIMIDEMTALQRVVFENVDALCRQLCRNNLPFGGKIVILTGDWKQQLTVVEDSYGPAAQVAACIQSSSLYPLFSTFELTQNMRLLPGQQAHLAWLDKIGKDQSGDRVPIELDMLVHSRDELIQWAFDQGFSMPSEEMLKRLLLATTNATVDLNNHLILQDLSEQYEDYYSVDRAMEDSPLAINAADYEVAQLNELTPIGMPPHHLRLKVGSIVVLLVNFNPARGLCNGTRLIVRKLTSNLIEAEAITGGSALSGNIIGIPKARFTHLGKKDDDVPFERFQFPVRVAFAMTFAKAQGQTIERLGIDLSEEPFAHGQLYTSVSRCTSREGIRIYAPNKPLDDQGRPLVRNVVAKGLDLS